MAKISKIMRSLGLAIAAMILAIACAQEPNADNGAPDAAATGPLISATNNWVGYGGHHVAVGKNFFSEKGLQVQDLFFQSASEQITAFLAGRVDLGWFTSGDAVQMAAKDPSIKIIYLVDYSNGSDGILGRQIQSPADIKGKTVARENILFEKVLLRAYLEKAGLTEQDVVIKDLAAADAAAAFAARQVDAAVTYEPYLSRSAEQGGGAVIFSTKDTNLIADVVVARDELIQSRKADLQAYFQAVDRAVKLLNAGDAEALGLVGKKLGISGEEVKEQLMGVKLFDNEGNKTVTVSIASSHPLSGPSAICP